MSRVVHDVHQSEIAVRCRLFFMVKNCVGLLYHYQWEPEHLVANCSCPMLLRLECAYLSRISI
jgi:hypothetical protein